MSTSKTKLKTPIALKHDGHKVVYFLVTKVASMSIRYTLFKDWDLKPHQIRMPEAWSDYSHYRWIAFTRHPLDRMVSLYSFMTRENKIFQSNVCNNSKTDNSLGIYAFFDQVAVRSDRRGSDMHFRSQDSMIPDKNMDFIGRFDNLVDDWNSLGLPPLAHRNPTKHKPWQNYYYDAFDNKLPIASRLERRFEVDFKRFDYQPLPQRNPNAKDQS